jgi:hypothetical protein
MTASEHLTRLHGRQPMSDRDDLRKQLEMHGGRLAILRVSKTFESGLHIPADAPVAVTEYPEGYVASYRPDPNKLSTHSFAVEADEFSWFVRASVLPPAGDNQ